MLSSMRFIVLGLNFKLLINFSWFLCMAWECLIYSSSCIQLSQHHLLTSCPFPSMSFWHLCWKWISVSGFTPGCSIMFHWSIDLFSCQFYAVFWGFLFVCLFFLMILEFKFILARQALYHLSHASSPRCCFNYVSLKYKFKFSGVVLCLFCLRHFWYSDICVSIWILGLLFLFCEKWHWNFDTDCIESVYHFGYYGHFNNINFPIHKRGLSFQWFASSSVSSMFYSV
jgi:hypothetical protein